MSSFTFAIALQIADILTTLYFLSIGVEEGNPIIRFLFNHFSHLTSLLIMKAASVGLVVACYTYSRKSLMKVNILYGAVILWNITAIGVQTLSK